MTIPAPTYVIFDMDGTTVRHINPWILNVLEHLDDYSYKIGGWFSQKFGMNTRKEPFAGIVNRGNEKKKRLLVHKALHSVRKKDLNKIVEPCPGIYDVLLLLKEHKIPIGIASNGLGKGYGHDVLDVFGLEDFFETRVFREDLRHAKPHPEALLKAISGYKRTPKAEDVIWYIGDRWKDIQAAFAAKPHVQATIIPFAYGLNATLHSFIEGKLTTKQRIVDYHDLESLLKSLLSAPK